MKKMGRKVETGSPPSAIKECSGRGLNLLCRGAWGRTHQALLIVAAVAILGVGGFGLALLAPHFKKVERRTASMPTVVQMSIPRPIQTVTETLKAMFNSEADLNQGTHKQPKGDRLYHFYLYPYGHPLFPEDYLIQHWSKTDPDLRPYAAVPQDQRQNDFYLYEPTADYYWFSDYYYHDVPAKFRCAFIIHLEPAGDNGTKIAVFEYLPTIWVGERFGFSAHAVGPALLHDIRFVQSTGSDRIRLLDKIRAAVE
jgi:hypothetical protein